MTPDLQPGGEAASSSGHLEIQFSPGEREEMFASIPIPHPPEITGEPTRPLPPSEENTLCVTGIVIFTTLFVILAAIFNIFVWLLK